MTFISATLYITVKDNADTLGSDIPVRMTRKQESTMIELPCLPIFIALLCCKFSLLCVFHERFFWIGVWFVCWIFVNSTQAVC